MPVSLDIELGWLLAREFSTRPNAKSKSWLVIHEPRYQEFMIPAYTDLINFLKHLGIEDQFNTLSTNMINEGFCIIEFDGIETANEVCSLTENWTDGDNIRKLNFYCQGFGWAIDDRDIDHLRDWPIDWPVMETENT